MMLSLYHAAGDIFKHLMRARGAGAFRAEIFRFAAARTLALRAEDW